MFWISCSDLRGKRSKRLFCLELKLNVYCQTRANTSKRENRLDLTKKLERLNSNACPNNQSAGSHWEDCSWPTANGVSNPIFSFNVLWFWVRPTPRMIKPQSHSRSLTSWLLLTQKLRELFSCYRNVTNINLLLTFGLPLGRQNSQWTPLPRFVRGDLSKRFFTTLKCYYWSVSCASVCMTGCLTALFHISSIVFTSAHYVLTLMNI